MKLSSIAILAVGVPTIVQAGGFASSCAQVFLGGTWINALCKNSAGTYIPTARDLNAEIGNANGLLVRRSSGYASVCRDCSLTTVGLFKCSCPRINRYQAASINLNNFLSNRNGILTWD
ncbi:uncharacterized protein DFL_005585 [Arthrobotrys flagrans]|uniref:Cyanovirin-N domain-containing protein n=1 Tax=Arthrobotrys flagrans TaxID=97331 RepID=A0A436ZXV4_ARTFL|nr:hypothetical protein DFL_005585 [Arthrobotrys flagrans]